MSTEPLQRSRLTNFGRMESADSDDVLMPTTLHRTASGKELCGPYYAQPPVKIEEPELLFFREQDCRRICSVPYIRSSLVWLKHKTYVTDDRCR